MLLAPSILAADLADLAGAVEVCREGGADLIHVDVMDGRFVPNLTFGPPVVGALAARGGPPLDVHLMVEDPGRLLPLYLIPGVSQLSVHWEVATHLDRLLARIREGGCRAGVALNPATPVEVLRDILGQLDFVLLMSVNPGFAGQPFLPYVLNKARRLRSLARDAGAEIEIAMDGGLGPDNIRQAVDAGVELCVAGSAVFAAADPVQAIAELRRAAVVERV